MYYFKKLENLQKFLKNNIKKAKHFEMKYHNKLMKLLFKTLYSPYLLITISKIIPKITIAA